MHSLLKVVSTDYAGKIPTNTAHALQKLKGFSFSAVEHKTFRRLLPDWMLPDDLLPYVKSLFTSGQYIYVLFAVIHRQEALEICVHSQTGDTVDSLEYPKSILRCLPVIRNIYGKELISDC